MSVRLRFLSINFAAYDMRFSDVRLGTQQLTSVRILQISPAKKTVAEPFVVTAGIGDLSDHRRVRYGSEEVSVSFSRFLLCVARR